MRPLLRFWAMHEESVDLDGKKLRLRQWGASTRSTQDAAQRAVERVRRLIAHGGPGKVPADEYYPRTPLREEVLEDVTGPDGELLAVITRNRYGSEVLATDAVLIADVDLPAPTPPPPSASPQHRGGFWGLFRRRREEPEQVDTTAAEEEEQEKEALSRVQAFAQAHPQWGVHVHRTAAGLRVLVTGTMVDPGGDEAQDLLAELGSDPVYAVLCRAQETFRARLTPKPWRCRDGSGRATCGSLAMSWPAAGRAEEQRRDTWVQAYEQHRAGHAALRRLSWNGVEPSPAERVVLDLHDRRCGADSGLPLA